MSLPDLIEIVPVTQPVRAEITVPGSKSITNRALVLAALGDGETTLAGALWSEDTQVMVECLQELGFMVNVATDPSEPCNRTITVYGLDGKVPRGGTAEQPLELFVGNAGTTARFLAAMVCLGEGFYRLHGVPRMHERPQAALFDALHQLGYRIESETWGMAPPFEKTAAPGLSVRPERARLPARVQGGGPRRRTCQVSIAESSQFASALILCAKVGGWAVEVVGDNAEESPYVAMTFEMREVFPRHGGRFRIEPDASSASYVWAAQWLLARGPSIASPMAGTKITLALEQSFADGWQIDAQFPRHLPLPDVLSRERHLGDSIMTAIVLAPFASNQIRFTDLGRLRVQECERVQALRTELTKCGGEVLEHDDTLVITPSPLHGAEIETCNDHRMAMCFAILGLK